MRATDDPPELTHIAQKTTREWIFAWLKNPQAYAISATMPNFELSDADARDLSAFLIDQSTPLSPAIEAKSPSSRPGTDDAPEGATLYGESFCASCHAAQNAAGILTGGDVGPELTRVSSGPTSPPVKIPAAFCAAWQDAQKDSPYSVAPSGASSVPGRLEGDLASIAGLRGVLWSIRKADRSRASASLSSKLGMVAEMA